MTKKSRCLVARLDAESRPSATSIFAISIFAEDEYRSYLFFMLPPEDDLEARKSAWDAMHVLFLDTDVDGLYLDDAARKCAETRYSLEDLELIFWREVYPTMRSNLWDVAGAWAPFNGQDLKAAILKRHRFGRRIWFRSLRSYPTEYWGKLSAKIIQLRGAD